MARDDGPSLSIYPLFYGSVVQCTVLLSPSASTRQSQTPAASRSFGERSDLMRQTDRQTDRDTEREGGERERDRERDRETQRERERERGERESE